MYLIKKVSEISGVSVRTLHHYDKIGLLSPKKNKNGYRYYSEDDISFLQMILYYKYLGFSLGQIKELIRQEDEEILYHLRKQLTLMQNEKQRLLTLIDTLEKTIESKERRVTMSVKEKFKGFTYQDNEKYKQAAVDTYGKEVIEQAIEKQKGKEKEIADGFNEIFFAFSENLSNELSPTSKENIGLEEADMETSGIDVNMSDEDILNILAGTSVRVQKVIPIPRLGVPFTIQSVTDREMSNFRKEASKKKKVGGQQIDEFNNDVFGALILGAGLIKPKLTKEFLQEQGYKSAMGFLRSTLLPGEIQAIIDEISELSGYGVELDEGLLKNA